MLDKHVLNRSGGRGVGSPADILWRPGFATRRNTRQLEAPSNRLPPVLPPSRQIEAGELDANDWDASDEDV
jgi:hypothetical protein